jgi:hypothetical protein
MTRSISVSVGEGQNSGFTNAAGQRCAAPGTAEREYLSDDLGIQA